MPISQDARRIQRASPTPIHTTTSPSQQALIWQKSLIGTAVAKVDTDKNLYTQTIPVNRKVLVVGAGIAGIQTALNVADAGFPVTLVERNPSIGGKMVKLDKTFPTMDCSACICTPKMSEAGNHPNITIKTLSEVEKVTGYIGNFEATIRERAKYIDYDLCTGCGACETKCPSKTTNEFDEGLSLRKAIYKPFAQAVPSKPTIDPNSRRKLIEGKCGVCAKICPTGAIRYDDTDRTTTETFGAIILATGYDLIDWTKLYGEYGGGNYPDLITGLQFERLVNASGPTEGHKPKSSMECSIALCGMRSLQPVSPVVAAHSYAQLATASISVKREKRRKTPDSAAGIAACSRTTRSWQAITIPASKSEIAYGSASCTSCASSKNDTENRSAWAAGVAWSTAPHPWTSPRLSTV